MKLSRIYNELVNREWAGNKDTYGSKLSADTVLNYFGDNTDIRSLDYNKLCGFVEYLRKQGKSGSTINRKLAALSKMYTVARRHDPKIMRPEIPRQKEGKPRQRVLTDGEAKALVSYEWTMPEHKSLTVLLMDTGVRPGEITDGEWSVNGDELTLRDTKNGEDRTVLLTPEAKDAALFLKGKRVVYDRYYRSFRRACAELGLEDVMPYTMRHSALTRLAERVDNVLLIQKWAGHRNLNTTQRYVKATRKGMEKLADALRRN